MYIAFLIPVGPGHQKLVQDAMTSILDASWPKGWRHDVFTFDDTAGQFGRSFGRNALAERATREGADWLFFIDADDLLDPDAMVWVQDAITRRPELEAIWGQITRQRAWRGGDGLVQRLEVMRSDDDVAPISDFASLLDLPGHSTLRVGNLLVPELFDRVGGFIDRLDVGEDHEFHYATAAHAKAFEKVAAPLVWIRTWLEGASGPRGYVKGDPRLVQHRSLGERVAQYWRDRGQEPWTEHEKGLREQAGFYEWEEDLCR